MSKKKRHNNNRPKKEQTAVVPQKISHTKKEKLLEILSVVFCIISAAVQIFTFAAGFNGKAFLITGIITLIECAAFTFGSLNPHYAVPTNDPRFNTEENFRNIRLLSIIAKFAISGILLLVALIMI